MKAIVIGAGSIARRHIGNLYELGVEEIRVHTRSEGRLTLAISQFPDLIPCMDRAEIERIPRDITLVCTPPTAHLEYAIDAARAGSHLFLEKPVAASMDGVPEMIRDVEASGIRNVIGYNYRYWASLRRVKEIVDRGGIGEIHTFRVVIGQYLPDWHPWENYKDWFMSRKEEGGGILLDLTHAIDYIHWMFGPYESVSSFNGNAGNFDMTADDFAALTVFLSSGQVGTFHLDCLSRKGENTLTLIGSDRHLRWDGLTDTIETFDPESGTTTTETRPAERNEMFIAEMKDFLRYVEEGGESPNSIREGAHALAVADAVRASSANDCVRTKVDAIQEGRSEEK